MDEYEYRPRSHIFSGRAMGASDTMAAFENYKKETASTADLLLDSDKKRITYVYCPQCGYEHKNQGGINLEYKRISSAVGMYYCPNPKCKKEGVSFA